MLPKHLALVATAIAVTSLPGFSMIWTGQEFPPFVHAYFAVGSIVWLPMLLTSGVWQLSIARRRSGTPEVAKDRKAILTPIRALLLAAILLGIVYLIDTLKLNIENTAVFITLVFCVLTLVPLAIYGSISLLHRLLTKLFQHK